MKFTPFKLTALLFLLLSFFQNSFSQVIIEKEEEKVRSNSGRFYVYWGWNRGYFSDSDINFKGDTYDFTLFDVVAKDRQSKFSLETYFKPSSLTVPQTNFGVGYYFRDKWIFTISMDHMKYVVQTAQEVKIDGYIREMHDIYDGEYSNENIVIQPSFLQMEHTDGLNYFNFGISRADNLLQKCKWARNKIELQIVEGFETGLLIPSSDITLLRQDDINTYHFAGWGASLKTGLHLTLFKHYFLHGEIKGGYINLFDILTSSVGNNKATQDFFFIQTTIQFGGIFYFR